VDHTHTILVENLSITIQWRRISPEYPSYSSAPAANATAVEIQIEFSSQRSLYLSLQVAQATAHYMGRFHFLTHSGPFTRTLGFLTRLGFCNILAFIFLVLKSSAISKPGSTTAPMSSGSASFQLLVVTDWIGGERL
jgi:hypothetical protein